MATPTDDIKQDVTTSVETSVGEEKPDSEVMSMDIPAEFLEQAKTPSTETKTPEKEEKVETKTPTEENSEEDESSREDVKQVSDNEWTDEDQKHLSDRAQKRIRELNEKAKKAEELETELQMLREEKQNELFAKTLDSIQKPVTPPKFDLNAYPSFGEILPQIENLNQMGNQDDSQNFEERVLTPEEYQQDVYKAASLVVEQKISEYQKGLEIQEDLKSMESKYPELNPKSSEYSDSLSRKLGSLFDAQLKASPNAKLGEFIDSIMNLREEKAKIMAKKVESTISARTIEQKAEEAISPHEVEPEQEKPFEELSLDEKEEYLKGKGLWDQ
jgi:hypothetical protein